MLTFDHIVNNGYVCELTFLVNVLLPNFILVHLSEIGYLVNLNCFSTLGVCSRNNMAGSEEWDKRMMDTLKNFDLNSPEIKQQFGKSEIDYLLFFKL